MKRVVSVCLYLCIFLSLCANCALATSYDDDSVLVGETNKKDITNLDELIFENINVTYARPVNSEQGENGVRPIMQEMHITGTVMGPADVKQVTTGFGLVNISDWDEERVEEYVKNMLTKWRGEEDIVIDKNKSLPFNTDNIWNVVAEDAGTRLDVILFGLDENGTPIAYKRIPCFIPYNLKELSSDISVCVGNEFLVFDQPPVIENGRTLVPLRNIFEALGAIVEWDGTNNTVLASKDDIQISLQIGSDELYVNGEARTLDVSAKIINERTMIPMRAVAEAFGCKVDWVSETKTVVIE